MKRTKPSRCRQLQREVHSREEQLEFRRNLQLLESCHQPFYLCYHCTKMLAPNPEARREQILKAGTVRRGVEKKKPQCKCGGAVQG